MKLYAGIDAGSTYLKVALVNNRKNLLGIRVVPTGIDARETAREALETLCREQGVRPLMRWRPSPPPATAAGRSISPRITSRRSRPMPPEHAGRPRKISTYER